MFCEKVNVHSAYELGSYGPTADLPTTFAKFSEPSRHAAHPRITPIADTLSDNVGMLTAEPGEILSWRSTLAWSRCVGSWASFFGLVDGLRFGAELSIWTRPCRRSEEEQSRLDGLGLSNHDFIPIPYALFESLSNFSLRWPQILKWPQIMATDSLRFLGPF